MKIGILTRRLPPEICGVGDHTLQLAKSLESTGVEVIVLASQGSPRENVKIVPDNYTHAGLTALTTCIYNLELDLLVLQYVPYLYLHNNQGMGANLNLFPFWLQCSQNVSTAIIVHEMYYQRWWDSRTWLRGHREKKLAWQVTGTAQTIFCASDVLLRELRQWHPHRQIVQLAISSNVPHCPLSSAERQHQRQQLGITPKERVIILFGASNSLVSQWVRGLEQYLHRQGFLFSWLLLGGLSPQKLRLKAPVWQPGYLKPEHLSLWLQLGDLFYVPHDCGVCAKRTTTAAALQHGLPVVGTQGCLTDRFWVDVPGMTLVPVGQPQLLYKTAYTVLCQKQRLIPQHETQAYYQQHLSWPVVARRFLAAVQSAT